MFGLARFVTRDALNPIQWAASSRGQTKLAPSPAAKVHAEPNNANHGQARAVAKNTQVIPPKPVTSPTRAAR